MPEFYMILARKIGNITAFFVIFACPKKIGKIPEFYMIFAEKCPNLHNNCQKKNIFPNFRGWGHVPPASISYAYMSGRKGVATS